MNKVVEAWLNKPQEPVERKCLNCFVETKMNYRSERDPNGFENSTRLIYTCPLCKSEDTDHTDRYKLAVAIQNARWLNMPMSVLRQVAGVIGVLDSSQ